MTFAYFSNIPDDNNDPKIDQPRMKINTNSISSWIDIDHIGFKQINGGTHRVVTFAGFAAPSAPTGVQSVLYPAAGVADPTLPQLYFRNANMILPISLIKAYGVFVAGSAVFLNQYNFNATITGGLLPTSVLTVNPNIITGNNVGVLLSTPGPAFPSITYTYNANVLTINNLIANNRITVALFQI